GDLPRTAMRTGTEDMWSLAKHKTIPYRCRAPAISKPAVLSEMTASLPAVLEYPFPVPPPPGEVIEVAPGILWLRMPLPFALDHINLWLVRDGAGWTSVDCGIGSDATRALWERHFATVLRDAPIIRI